MARAVKIMVVEDHALFREMMCGVCRRDFGWNVVAETGLGAEAVRLARHHAPDVIILDLHLPDMDGFAVMTALRAMSAQCRILVVSSRCDDFTLHQIERAQVNGFVDKNGTTQEGLKTALTRVSEGQCYYSQLYQKAKLARRTDSENFAARLTEWEQGILSLIGQALSDDEIAEVLKISPKTVMTHRSRIMKKLNVSGTPKLIRYALDHGFTHIEPRANGNAEAI